MLFVYTFVLIVSFTHDHLVIQGVEYREELEISIGFLTFDRVVDCVRW